MRFASCRGSLLCRHCTPAYADCVRWRVCVCDRRRRPSLALSPVTTKRDSPRGTTRLRAVSTLLLFILARACASGFRVEVCVSGVGRGYTGCGVGVVVRRKGKLFGVAKEIGCLVRNCCYLRLFRTRLASANHSACATATAGRTANEMQQPRATTNPSKFDESRAKDDKTKSVVAVGLLVLEVLFGQPLLRAVPPQVARGVHAVDVQHCKTTHHRISTARPGSSRPLRSKCKN